MSSSESEESLLVHDESDESDSNESQSESEESSEAYESAEASHDCKSYLKLSDEMFPSFTSF